MAAAARQHSILNVPTTQFRNVTANSVTNSNSGNDVIQVSGVVSPAPKSERMTW